MSEIRSVFFSLFEDYRWVNAPVNLRRGWKGCFVLTRPGTNRLYPVKASHRPIVRSTTQRVSLQHRCRVDTFHADNDQPAIITDTDAAPAVRWGPLLTPLDTLLEWAGHWAHGPPPGGPGSRASGPQQVTVLHGVIVTVPSTRWIRGWWCEVSNCSVLGHYCSTNPSVITVSWEQCMMSLSKLSFSFKREGRITVYPGSKISKQQWNRADYMNFHLFLKKMILFRNSFL